MSIYLRKSFIINDLRLFFRALATQYHSHAPYNAGHPGHVFGTLRPEKRGLGEIWQDLLGFLPFGVDGEDLIREGFSDIKAGQERFNIWTISRRFVATGSSYSDQPFPAFFLLATRAPAAPIDLVISCNSFFVDSILSLMAGLLIAPTHFR